MQVRSTAQFQNTEDFVSGEKLTDVQGGAFTHVVHKVTNKNDNTNYFQKQQSGRPLVTATEATAGQIVNLLMPHQPRTLLAKNSANQQFILSQELPGYTSLTSLYHNETGFDALKASIHNGTIKGFGSVLTVGYFLNETDAKLGNMGIAIINGQTQLIKIDGDWCFSALRRPDKFGYDKPKLTAEITQQGISELPLLSNYSAHNWVDYLQEGKINNDYNRDDATHFIEDSLSDAPHFRQEVNEMMLKILLLPQELSQEIASRNTDDEKIYETISNEINNRQTQMHTAALKNDSFITFLQSPEAKACLDEMKNNIEKFQKENNLPVKDFTEQMKNKFEAISNQAKPGLQVIKIEKNIAALREQYENGNGDARQRHSLLQKIKEQTIAALAIKTDDVDKTKRLEGDLTAITNEIFASKAKYIFDHKLESLTNAQNEFYQTSMDPQSALLFAQQIVAKAHELQGLTTDEHAKAQFGIIADNFIQHAEEITANMAADTEENQNDGEDPDERSSFRMR